MKCFIPDAHTQQRLKIHPFISFTASSWRRLHSKHRDKQPFKSMKVYINTELIDVASISGH